MSDFYAELPVEPEKMDAITVGLTVEVPPCVAQHSIGPHLVRIDHGRSLVMAAPAQVLPTSM